VEREVRCGCPFQASGGRLRARFPERAETQSVLAGTVEVPGPVRGVGSAAADVFLLRDGRVVTTPIAQDAIGVRWDLRAGETSSVPGLVSLVSCETGGPLAPGVYALYVRVVITPDDGPPQESFGGPWPVRVLSR
jgi:hypothetical protein